MNERHVGEELLAYLDGELRPGERARVAAHLERCPACAAELAELQAFQRDLDLTLEATLGQERLSRHADDRIREQLQRRLERPARAGWAARWRALWRQRGVLAQAALALLILFFSAHTTLTLRMPAAPPPQEIWVLGQQQFAPGSEAALRVIVRTAARGAPAPAGAPIAGAEVLVRLLAPSGAQLLLFQGETNAAGSADITFQVPEGVEGEEMQLLVETRTAAGTETLLHPIDISRTYKVYLASDKPAYRPGQLLHARALVLEALDLRPAAGQVVTWGVTAPNGDTLARNRATLSEYGIAAWDVQLPDNAAEGSYTLWATLGDTRSERSLHVAEYELPPFRVALETARTYYAPGERVAGTVSAGYFFGKPVAGNVRVWGYVAERDAPFLELAGALDEEGAFNFVFTVPPTLTAGTVTLEAAVRDAAGQEAGLRQPLALYPDPLLIQAVPESGVLKPGVPNDVYVMTAYPDGTPAPTTLLMQWDGEEQALETDAFGFATFSLVPEGATVLSVAAQDATGATAEAEIVLPAAEEAKALLLHAEQAIYEVGDTLRLEALLAGVETGTAYLDVLRDEQMVAALSAPLEAGRATWALDVTPDWIGGLTLRAYVLLPNGERLGDVRVIVVDPPRDLDVAVSADQARYRPGETARVQITTTQEAADGTQRGVPAVVGLAVVDSSVLALETLPPGFARSFFLLEEAQLARQGAAPGLDLPALWADDAARAAQNTAAQAAWAGAGAMDFPLVAQGQVTPPDVAAAARRALVGRLTWVLSLLPLLAGIIVVRGLRPSGVLPAAWRRLAWGALATTLLAPLLIGGGLLGWLLPWLGRMAFLVTLAATGLLLLGLWLYGWLRPDTRVQIIGGGLVAYLVLAGLLVLAAARSDVAPGWWAGGLAVGLLVLVAAVALLGQGLILEGRRRAGWGFTLLAGLLVLLVVALPAVPALASELARAWGNPAIYVGPVGWLSGCGAATEAPLAEEEAGEPTGEPTEEEPAAEASPAPTAAPTATPAPARTATPVATVEGEAPLPIPAEPYPLRQLFPETLYWAPQAHTGPDGALSLALPLADTLTTWRLTALASTREGAIGAASYDLTVIREFFLDVRLPSPTPLAVGEAVTVTVTAYNDRATPQAVRWQLAPQPWYTLLRAPEALTVPGGGVASTTLLLRPEMAGEHHLEVAAVGAQVADRVRIPVEVVPGE